MHILLIIIGIIYTVILIAMLFFPKWLKKWLKKIRQMCSVAWMNKHRITMVITLTIFSVLICVVLFIWPCQLLEKIKANIHAPIFVFTLSVLPSFYFWVIRNKDRLDAIKEQQESNKNAQEANDYTSFSHALTLFAAKEIETKAIGLKLLIQIRNKPNSPFTKDIDLATEYAKLNKANLTDANLQKANLEGVNLREANLKNADLTGANLEDANLTETKLQSANLEEVTVKTKDLEKAYLVGANLTGLNLSDIDWEGKDLQGTILTNTDLTEADLRNANLGEANLEGADLSGIKLEGAKLRGASLSGKDLFLVNFNNVDLAGAKFQGSIEELKGAHWAFAQNIELAIFDNKKIKEAVLALKAKVEKEYDIRHS